MASVSDLDASQGASRNFVSTVQCEGSKGLKSNMSDVTPVPGLIIYSGTKRDVCVIASNTEHVNRIRKINLRR